MSRMESLSLSIDPAGPMGKKLRFQSRSQGFEIESADARWSDMLDKFIVLNRGGGHPTELAGISSARLLPHRRQTTHRPPSEDFRAPFAEPVRGRSLSEADFASTSS